MCTSKPHHACWYQRPHMVGRWYQHACCSLDVHIRLLSDHKDNSIQCACSSLLNWTHALVSWCTSCSRCKIWMWMTGRPASHIIFCDNWHVQCSTLYAWACWRTKSLTSCQWFPIALASQRKKWPKGLTLHAVLLKTMQSRSCSICDHPDMLLLVYQQKEVKHRNTLYTGNSSLRPKSVFSLYLKFEITNEAAVQISK